MVKKKISRNRLTDHSDAEVDNQGFKITVVNVLKDLRENG